MKVLITGAEGQLGKELQIQINRKDIDIDIIKTNHKTLDISNFEQVKEKLSLYRPDIIINCAAYTAVDDCEKEIEKAYMNNAIGPKHLAIEADNINAKLVHISTDYVFDGEQKMPKREYDQTLPKNIYGASKLLGEEYVKMFCKKFFILRTAWLYGEGNNFVHTILKLSEKNNELNIVGDQFGTPTSTKDLAKTIIDLMQTECYGTFHATCEGECSWYEFAKKICEIKKIDIIINKVTSEQVIRPAKRPQYSILDNFMLRLYEMNNFRHWEEALQDYLKG